MSRFVFLFFSMSVPMGSIACGPPDPPGREGSFGYDLSFLQSHVETLVLREGPAQLAVVPAWQGRVMTSTNGGETGPSFGWINYDLIRSGEIQAHITPYGGEDRIWLGPEGGQFSIFFEPGAPFDLEHWQTPAFMDTEPFDTVSHTDREAIFSRSVRLQNYSEAPFEIQIERAVRLLDGPGIGTQLGINLEGVDVVAFESENRLSNAGTEAWKRESGLLSIWILGMYVPSNRTTVIIPLRRGEEPVEGNGAVNDRYFGAVPADRLIVDPEVVFFKADGRHRSKIGIARDQAAPVLGSWDGDRGVLTLVHYNESPPGSPFVNSMWEIQEQPYAGDVVNSYNDGPPAPGVAPLGPFYELETSSPAAALNPGEEIVHFHRTIHLTGAVSKLDEIARAVLGVGLEEMPW